MIFESLETETPAPALALTLDDLIKVVVKKIKADSGNTEKIRALLASYGVKKVEELPAEKYESLMTDLGAL